MAPCHAVLAVALLASSALWTAAEAHSRDRRALVFGGSPVVQLTAGVGMPVFLPNRSLTMSWSIQAQFMLPTNASQLEPLLVAPAARGGRSVRALYRQAEAAFGSADCLLRTICHAAAEPIHPAGLLEEVVSLMLTPSEEDDAEGELAEYLLAERLGSEGADCSAYYSACPRSPLDSFTRTLDEFEAAMINTSAN